MTTPQHGRRLPIGAEVSPEGGVHFRVWAPRCRAVAVVLEGGERRGPGGHPRGLDAEGNGYFSGRLANAGPGTLYRFRLNEEDQLYPDPASRFQPHGLHGPSQVVDPGKFSWT